MLWSSSGIREAKEEIGLAKPSWSRSLEGLGTLGRLGVEVFCCSCIPTTFFSGLFTAWRAAERFDTEDFGFLFDNTSIVLSLCLHLFSLNLCHLISAVDVILFGLDCSSILLYAYVHIPHISCLIISLNL